jgi:anhydro-N-acetylmuramic acid kinase
VISDFRRSATAAGGEGAPLSPILHEALFRHKRKWRAIVNIGGISNVTVLAPRDSKSKPFAADCGPGNMLIDRAMLLLYGKPYDRNGRVASKGIAHIDTVREALSDPFFSKKPPKSTGRELFGKPYLEKVMQSMGNVSPEDMVSTLTEITIRGIADFLARFAPRVEEIFICGGGAHNKTILDRLGLALPRARVATTADLSYDPDYLEALLWAYLARRFIKLESVAARNFTGAKYPYIPGRLCLP